MSRNGAGIYELPSIYEAVPGETVLAEQHNTPLEDIAQDLNTPRPVNVGGTGGDSPQAALDNLFDSGAYVRDTRLIIADADNVTRKARLDLADVTGGQTRVFKVPDRNGTLMTGPGTTVDNTIPRFDGTTGNIQTSGATIADNGNMGVVGTLSAAGLSISGTATATSLSTANASITGGSISGTTSISTSGNINTTGQIYSAGNIQAYNGSNGRVYLSPSGNAFPGEVLFYNGTPTLQGRIGGVGSRNFAISAANGLDVIGSGLLNIELVTEFKSIVSIAVGTYGVAEYLTNWGWSTGFAPWRWRILNDANLSLYSFNGSTGALVGQVLGINNSTRAVQFIGNISTQGGVSATLASAFGGNVSISGALSKGSGTFLIDHPLDPENKDLLHGFVEAPEYQNRYRGLVRLVDGQATIDIDAVAGMTPGTFAAITQDVWVQSLQNQDGFTRLRPSKVVDGVFTIYAEDPECTDEVAWEVTAARADPFVKSSLDPNTDEDGRLIVEREKEAADE